MKAEQRVQPFRIQAHGFCHIGNGALCARALVDLGDAECFGHVFAFGMYVVYDRFTS